ILYSPDANYNGPDSFTYTATDNGTTNGSPDPRSDTGTVSVTVTEVNDPPVANPDAATVAEDGSVAIDAAGNDSPGPANESSQLVHVSHVDAPAHGSATIISSGPDAGKILYSPDANYNGPDSFTYTATDNGTTNGSPDPRSDTGTVSVTVTEVNDRPTASASPDHLNLNEGASQTAALSGNDVETADAGLKFTITQVPAHGTLKHNLN